MTSDKFVRITLVVIAVSLFKIAFFDVSTIQNAYANQVHKVALCDEYGTCTGIARGGIRIYNSGN